MKSRGKKDPHIAQLKRILQKAFLCLFGTHNKKSRATVHIAYLPDEEMRRLARRFLGERKKNIDVLAFPEGESFPHPEAKGYRPLGEIYLRHGLGRKPMPMRGFFVIHGLLHLLHYTHDKKRDSMVMEGLERLLFKKLFPHTPHPWPRTATVPRTHKKAKHR